MATKKPRQSDWIACKGYTLDVRRSGTDFTFQLIVEDNKYSLDVEQMNDRTGLVQRALRVIADRWPAFDWEFQADDNGKMTDIR
jgi:hypothetical protein